MSSTPKKASFDLCAVFKRLIAIYGEYSSSYNLTLEQTYCTLGRSIISRQLRGQETADRLLREISFLIDIHGKDTSVKGFKPATPLEILALYGNLPTAGQKQL